uniref:Uncharacterized protein n=1 Tax=Rhizophora mucronata TaxID=61149 RepID=A0A2P2QQS4_RHIMU
MYAWGHLSNLQSPHMKFDDIHINEQLNLV